MITGMGEVRPAEIVVSLHLRVDHFTGLSKGSRLCAQEAASSGARVEERRLIMEARSAGSGCHPALEWITSQISQKDRCVHRGLKRIRACAQEAMSNGALIEGR